MFRGSNVALVTPFKGGVVDFCSLEHLINWQIESGTGGILVAGSTGEGLLISDEERVSIINTSSEIINNRVPLIVGCSAASTLETIRLTKQAEKLKADGVLVIVPFYVKPTQAGIIEHFKSVHNSSNIPIIMYNNPGRCSVGASVGTIISIASSFSRVVALKDSDTNTARIPLVKSAVKNLVMLSGDDPSLAGYLASGGDGTISVTANIAPLMVSSMIKAWQNGDLSKMQELNSRLVPLSESLFVEANPIPIKYALYKKGMIENELRLPLTTCSETTKDALNNLSCD